MEVHLFQYHALSQTEEYHNEHTPIGNVHLESLQIAELQQFQLCMDQVEKVELGNKNAQIQGVKYAPEERKGDSLRGMSETGEKVAALREEFSQRERDVNCT